MADCMVFPRDWEKFLEDYSFRDKEEIYTNGAKLIPTFRVEQMMEHYLEKATEDAVPVVRCNDCVHWRKDVPGCTDFVGRCEWANYMVGAAGYCVYGERGEDEKTD